MEKMLTKKDVSKMLGVSEATVNRLMNRGLPYYRFGYNMVRFKRDEVNCWVKRRAEKGYGREENVQPTDNRQ